MNQHSRPNTIRPEASPHTDQGRSAGAFPNRPINLAHSLGQSDLLPRPRPRVLSLSESRYRSPETSNGAERVKPGASIPFPEPQIFHPSVANSFHLQTPQRTLHHRHSRSEFRPRQQITGSLQRGGSEISVVSASSSYGGTDGYESHPDFLDENTEHMSLGLSNMHLNQDDALQSFQNDKLKDEDQEWHLLVPKEAQEALGKKEVHRQSVLFEIIKGERDYVADLEIVQRLFIDDLRNARPPIITEPKLSDFIKEVFGNLDEILDFHRRLLNALFARQREQHPLLQSIADIILDTAIKAEFRATYEIYIKHYPLAESCHRKELTRNQAYQNFLQSFCGRPQVRKRDLITFLSRPVTRLPRLSLLLEQSLKTTEKEFEHPDLETLPLILGILNDCIKSTQPGIEAAESKVKFRALCESIVYQEGEIIDMDLYDENRTLVYSSPVARRVRSDTGFHGWNELVATLLDNYFLLTKEEKRPDRSIVRRRLTSRPMHLSFLRLGSFADPPETRRERTEDGRLVDPLFSQTVTIFPFTIYHASSRSTRRYTLYVPSEAQRQKWRSIFVETMAVHRVREDSNKWFEPQKLSDRFFRTPAQSASQAVTPTPSRRITSVAPFSVAGRQFLAIGCLEGIFVSVAGDENFKKALHYPNPRYIAAIQTLGNRVFNRFIVHSGSSLVSYSLEMLARLALNRTTSQALDASMEAVVGNDLNIVFCRCVHIGTRAILIYASKRRLSSTLVVQAMEVISRAEKQVAPIKDINKAFSFKPLGEAGFIPKEVYDVTALTKNIVICAEDGIVIADPTNLARSEVTLVPDLSGASKSLPMSNLKARIGDAKPLGLVRVGTDELLVIHDMIGCYINRQGVPSRSCAYIRWETLPHGFAHRGTHILLVSPQFIEIRNVTTGRIVQVIEGVDIRLMYAGFPAGGKNDRILVAMRGDKSNTDGTFPDKLLQLEETAEYVPQTPASATLDMWEEWDM